MLWTASGQSGDPEDNDDEEEAPLQGASCPVSPEFRCFDWEHALFGSPVLFSTGQFRRSTDLFWIRTHLYF
ncbi:MAG: hypothetical protein JWO38_7337 [Gemmataceae bacterium]|nr:hypothetical protein [Gemmataceae bacterium]